MRVYMKISTPKEIVPFDHQPLLTEAIHKWLDWNEMHNKILLNSFSQLKGGKALEKGLEFNGGSTFFFSSYNANRLAGAIRAKLIEEGEKPKAKSIIDEIPGADVFVTLPCSNYWVTVNEIADSLEKSEQFTP